MSRGASSFMGTRPRWVGSVRAGFVDSLNSIADAAIPMSMAYIKVIKKKKKRRRNSIFAQN